MSPTGDPLLRIAPEFSASQAQLITDVVAAVRATVHGLLPQAKVRVEVVLDDDQAIPQWGVGGYCLDADALLLALSPEREADWQRHIPRTVAHEWHHVARWRGPGYGTGLADALISEGLAQHFELEAHPGDPSFYSVALTDAKMLDALATARREWDERSYNEGRWFFGKGELPFHAGYAASFRLVADYLSARASVASQQVAVSAAEVFRAVRWP